MHPLSHLVDFKDQVRDVSLQSIHLVPALHAGGEGAQQGLVQLETRRDVLQAHLLIGKKQQRTSS